MAHRVTVSSFQFAENDRGEQCHPAKDKERLVDAVNHLRRLGMKAVGKKERGGQRSRSDAETDGHLLHRAGDGAGAARLFLGDIGIDKRVHACVLQRREEPVEEHLHHDEPHRRAHPDGRKKQDEQADDHGVGNQHGAVAEAGQNSRHRHLQAHGSDRLRHHQQAGLNRREPQANLIQERKEKRDAANAKAGEETAAHRRAKCADAKQGQTQQGKCGLRVA